MNRTAIALLFGLGLFGCGSSGDGGGGGAPDAGGVDPNDFAVQPKSCAFVCPQTDCAESQSPYVCPSLGAWSAVPHDTACPAWDGTYPQSKPGQCTASAPTGEAAKYAGVDPDNAAVHILPDGRRLQPAGSSWIFNEPDLAHGFPQGLALVPGTSFALVVDNGYDAHSVRVVDLTKMGGAASPVVSYAKFDRPSTLNFPIAFVAPDLVLVATNDGHVQSLKLDTQTGQITKDATRLVPLPPSIDDLKHAANYYVSGLAVSPDGKRLVVASMFDPDALVFDLTAGNYGKQLGSVAIGDGGTFQCAFDPNDPTGRYVYASKWGGHAVVEIDLADASAPKVARTFAIDKDPQGLAFLDARWLAVANDFGDAIALVDRTSGAVTELPVSASPLHGFEPSTLAFDANAGILYATLAARNSVAAWKVDTTGASPKLTPAGALPTLWWPSAVAVDKDGSVVVTSLRGVSNGPLDQEFVANASDAEHGVAGGIQRVPTPTAADLSAGEAAVEKNDDVGKLAGAPAIACPAGANDFPVPDTNTQGPSKQITHVWLIVRENKAFDAILGDLPGANGDASLLMKKSSAGMDTVWPNFRAAVKAFATSDNYYTSAELSAQGHTWTTFGRSSDFTERTWHLDCYARDVWKSPAQPQGISDIGVPSEGSLFDWLGSNGVVYDILGEGEGQPKNVIVNGHTTWDLKYPGGPYQNTGYPDNERACYAAGRMRVLCNTGQFVYQLLMNDHTGGVSPTQASPETMIAVNDEATGMVLEAISHSPLWASSLVIVTEDDPAGGGDHVEHHRTPILFASPWVKRGYVSKTHVDVSSIHKLLAHIYGIPYSHEVAATAALPLDLFTSTPDFTPYDHIPRKAALTCGVDATFAEKRLTDSWRGLGTDRQKGLGAQVQRYLRGEQLEELPPDLEADVLAREASLARRAAEP